MSVDHYKCFSIYQTDAETINGFITCGKQESVGLLDVI